MRAARSVSVCMLVCMCVCVLDQCVEVSINREVEINPTDKLATAAESTVMSPHPAGKKDQDGMQRHPSHSSLTGT